MPHALAAALKTSAEAENSCRDTTKKEMGLLPCATRMLSLVLEPELVQSWMGGGGGVEAAERRGRGLDARSMRMSEREGS